MCDLGFTRCASLLRCVCAHNCPCGATGAERYVHVYLPPSYDGSTQWPIWVHLHGVFWATMGDIGARVREWCVYWLCGVSMYKQPGVRLYGRSCATG